MIADVVVVKTLALKRLFPQWTQKQIPLVSLDEIKILLKKSNGNSRFKSAYASCQTEKQLWTLVTADNTRPNGYTELRNQ
jgi:hypothetical protein